MIPTRYLPIVDHINNACHIAVYVRMTMNVVEYLQVTYALQPCQGMAKLLLYMHFFVPYCDTGSGCITILYRDHFFLTPRSR